jgi:hypothetical protein
MLTDEFRRGRLMFWLRDSNGNRLAIVEPLQ